MLILTLKEGEKILIGDKITVMVVEIRGTKSALGSRRRRAFWFCGKSKGIKAGDALRMEGFWLCDKFRIRAITFSWRYAHGGLRLSSGTPLSGSASLGSLISIAARYPGSEG